jgi:hypothetical protein
MAHFYGTVKGQRGEASRLGNRKSGLETVAASWQGAVKVRLYERDGRDGRDGRDYAEVRLIAWHGSGVDCVLYDGPVCGYDTVKTHSMPVYPTTGRTRATA